MCSNRERPGVRACTHALRRTRGFNLATRRDALLSNSVVFYVSHGATGTGVHTYEVPANLFSWQWHGSPVLLPPSNSVAWGNQGSISIYGVLSPPSPREPRVRTRAIMHACVLCVEHSLREHIVSLGSADEIAG